MLGIEVAIKKIRLQLDSRACVGEESVSCQLMGKGY